MKWALLVFVLTSVPEMDIRLVKTLEIETESLCVKAHQTFRDENLRLRGIKGTVPWIYQVFCIQVRE